MRTRPVRAVAAALACMLALAALAGCGRSVQGSHFRTQPSGPDTDILTATSGGTSEAPVPGAAEYTHASAVSGALESVCSAFVAAGSVDYHHLARDFARARAAYVPSLRVRFDEAKAATAAQYRSSHTVQTATVSEAALVAMPTPTSATILLIGYVTTTSDDTAGQPFVNAANVIITSHKVGSDWLISDQSTLQVKTPPRASAGATGTFDAGNRGMAAAVTAARKQITRSLNLTRKDFAAQREAILAGTTGGLTQLTEQSLETEARDQENGHFDTSGRVIAAAVRSVGPGTVAVLMCTTQERVTRSGKHPTLGVQRLVITMTLSPGNRWLATALTSVS